MAKPVVMTQYESYRTGKLALGCQLCVRGRKLVLFVTGLCSRRCIFCPISDQKSQKDVVFANEMPVSKVSDVISEAELCDSLGAGITGGDPLLRLERTVSYIRLLKRRFGKDFHIHLYTPLDNVDEQKLGLLHKAGLDEIRFHPDLDSDALWEKLLLARKFCWDVGIEIPVIPGKRVETIRLLDFVNGKVDFVNLNELELSDTNASRLSESGYVAKDDLSYGVRGSEELGKAVLKRCARLGLNAHYCTARLKDKYQLAKRIKHRAKNVAQRYDRVTAEGVLVRGAIYLDDLVPGAGYHEILKSADRGKLIPELHALRESLVSQFVLPPDMIAVDLHKLRLLTSTGIARLIHSRINNRCAIVEEYPTWDGFEVSLEFL